MKRFYVHAELTDGSAGFLTAEGDFATDERDRGRFTVEGAAAMINRLSGADLTAARIDEAPPAFRVRVTFANGGRSYIGREGATDDGFSAAERDAHLFPSIEVAAGTLATADAYGGKVITGAEIVEV